MSYPRKKTESAKDKIAREDREINMYLDYQLYGEESKVFIESQVVFKKQATLEYELLFNCGDQGPNAIAEKISRLCQLSNETASAQRRLGICRE